MKKTEWILVWDYKAGPTKYVVSLPESSNSCQYTDDPAQALVFSSLSELMMSLLFATYQAGKLAASWNSGLVPAKRVLGGYVVEHLDK